MSDYIELHCHSAFSLLDGASSPEALVERAHALGHTALALTDHDDLGGAVRFAQAASALQAMGGTFECIIGAELTLECGLQQDCGLRIADRGVLHRRTETSRVCTPTQYAARSTHPRESFQGVVSHLVLLAESREGYSNLSTLITRARMDHPRGQPRVSLDLLAQHADGLFALTGCPRGWVPSLVAAGDPDGACEAVATLLDIFDRRVAIECWDHGLPEERDIVRQLLPIARALEIPWVVTNDVHYAAPRGRIVHDVLGALRHERPLDEMGTRLRPNGEWYLKSAAQMVRRWQHAPEGIAATRAIAERCAFRMADLAPALPAFPLPPRVTADEYLARLVEQGAHERWGDRRTDTHDRQIAHELAIIRRLGLAGYFLIVWDIVRFARREGILCQGRGSAANSAVCYCLGITAVDPIKLELLFERFLSEDRQEAPDIDLDFAHRERERVIQYVYERYGREHAAMVCEQISWRGRSAVRDAARVLGFSVEQANALSLLSDRFSARATAARLRGEAVGADTEERGAEAEALGSQMETGTSATTRTLDEKRAARRVERQMTKADRPKPKAAYEPYGSPSARDSGSDRDGWLDPHARDTPEERRNPTTRLTTSGAEAILARAGLDARDPRVRALPAIVEGLHDLPRHRSIHVGGFVLTEEPLARVVPIEPASMEGRTVIQWEKDDLDPVGLVKIDLLGLGMLTLIQDCLKYIRETRGVTIDLAQLDMADQAVYDDLCRADTIGIFQVESRAQMSTLPRLKPRCFYDLVVEVAIIRPGPIQGDMVHPYLRRRAGEEPVTYPHPSLEPVLRRTMGVPLFQEQGMQVAITAAGFTPGEADALRRAMGHKRSRERMAAICQKLIAGMQRNGIPEETALNIYNQINAFADYGFPESHAASFALLVYASAYLKHYYAPEFTAAILNAQPMGFYAPGTLIEDARRHGVEVRPVDLTRSAWDSSLEAASGEWPVASAAEKTSRSGRKPRPRGSSPATSHQAPATRPPAVRLGIRLIRHLGPKARVALEEALRDGPFTSIEDVVHRVKLDRRALRALAEAGAFDAMLPDEPVLARRRAALWKLLEEFRGDAGPLAPRQRVPKRDPHAAKLPPFSPAELTEADYRMTGISLNGHPMRHLRPHLAPNRILTAREVARCRDGARIGVAGLVICRQRPGTAKGFVFLTLEDETGMVNVVVTPQRFDRQALLIATAPLLLVRGTLQIEQGVINLRGERFHELRAGAGEQWAESHDFH